MLFHSIEFTIFLPIVFTIYWFIVNKNLRLQNTFILISSYIFYGWWDWRFLSLIVISSVVDYSIGLLILKQKVQTKKKLLLLVTLLINIGFLGFFKYYNFFIDSFANAYTYFGKHIEPNRLNIILPVGISFYTFQTLSYSIDVYRGRIKPKKDIIAFFAFVSFFPQLVAGPIERASNLLPQFIRRREFSYHDSVDGMRQILWGFFKKMVLADNCAIIANEVFSNYQNESSGALLVGAIFFAFQIYGDFSGYSDIAIGTAKLFGFKLMQNFAFPYFSRDIAEFWRRWHISLSTWFRDYLYIPLGGSRGNSVSKVRNIFIIFLVSGFWHGANWTFIAWGFLNAMFFLPLLLMKKNRSNVDVVAESRILPNAKELLQMLGTFSITTIAWIFFRAETIADAAGYIYKMLISDSIFFPSNILIFANELSTKKIIPVFVVLTIEWINRKKEHGLQIDEFRLSRFARYAVYCILFFSILYFQGEQQEFIYFQF